MTDDTSIQTLRAAFEALGDRDLAALSAAESEQLKTTVRAAAIDLKKVGMPPDRIVITMRRIIEDTGVTISGSVLDKVAQWCVDAYYGEDT